jgi:hypothetical protein
MFLVKALLLGLLLGGTTKQFCRDVDVVGGDIPERVDYSVTRAISISCNQQKAVEDKQHEAPHGGRPVLLLRQPGK